jgi:hypothetical protein
LRENVATEGCRSEVPLCCVDRRPLRQP